MARRKSLKKNKSNSQFVFLVLGLLVLISLLYTVLFLKTTQNTINSQAQSTGSKGCSCDPYKYKCFDGSNASESFAGTGTNSLLYCCFGPYNDAKYVIFATSKFNYPHFETVVDKSCRNSKTPQAVAVNVNYKKAAIVAPANNSCNPTILNYGNCKNKSLWQKINENYDPTKDNAKYLGYYTDRDCLQEYKLSSCIPLIPPIPVIKNKMVIFTNPNAFDLVVIGGTITHYDANLKALISSEIMHNPYKSGPFFALSPFASQFKAPLNLTDDKVCNHTDVNYLNTTYKLDITYRRGSTMFWDSFVYGAITKKFDIPCTQDNFSIEVPLTYP